MLLFHLLVLVEQGLLLQFTLLIGVKEALFQESLLFLQLCNLAGYHFGHHVDLLCTHGSLLHMSTLLNNGLTSLSSQRSVRLDEDLRVR